MPYNPVFIDKATRAKLDRIASETKQPKSTITSLAINMLDSFFDSKEELIEAIKKQSALDKDARAKLRG